MKHRIANPRSLSSTSGMMLTKAISIIVVAAALVVIGAIVAFYPPTIGVDAASTRTTTVTQTQVATTLVNLGNYSSQGLNAEAIYAYANASIVILQGIQNTTTNTIFGSQTVQTSILGSGFVIDYSGTYYIVTNYHVAGQTSNLTVTFNDGNAYPAKLVGSDPYSDLAVVQASSAPSSEYHSLTVVPSSTLKVGQDVLAIGNPFGLSDTATLGIISQLGETIQDPTAGNFSIADVIQFSAPINPGNSGGALFDANGSVVGVTTATISGSQGIGFAIPSDTILRELPSLIANGTYTKHPYLGIGEVDMNYQLAQAAGSPVTYGAMIETIVPGGPAATAGLHAGTKTTIIEGQQYNLGGDIIVGINGTKILNENSLASYLEEHTMAGQKIVLEIIRSGQYMNVTLTLGQRPTI
jgi:S1-C subfamily serine protease